MKNFTLRSKRFLNIAFAILLWSCSGDDTTVTPDTEPEVDKPVAKDDSYTVTENEELILIDLLDNDTIFDFGRVASIDTETSKGGVVVDNRDGTFTYTPPSNFTGEDTFSYRLCDSSLPANCSTATVTITVNALAVLVQDDAYEVVEHNSLKITSYLDNDQLPLNYTVTELGLENSKGTAVLNEDGSITYTAPNGFDGEDSFTYTICDNEETPVCSTATITMTVIDEGTPVARNVDYVYEQNNEVIIIDSFTDNDDLIDDAIVTEISYSGSGSAVLNEDGTITYSSANNFFGEETITYSLCDDDEIPSCVSAVITITWIEEATVEIPTSLKYYYGEIAFSTDKDANYTIISTITEGKHTTYLDYGQRHDYLYDVDQDLSNSDNVILLYSGESRDSREYQSGNNTHSPQTFNTEHVYPQSLFDREPVKRGDLHHLRVADIEINSLRSNYPFADGSGEYELISGNSFYPGDEWKGDVARMILYLNVRYELSVDLVGNLDLFLKWNREDPVSDFERQRNEAIEDAQGNRNPFIDNPYLATLIWGGTPAENTWE
ncbi:Ig-like domain-containing protein [Leeuwenhoekiella marinoflava]|uniref:Endonuclease I n=2 Tax=Leeuwenhoekiella marinoflava TaxID=988 RepID=A0A4Q0PRG4_9FLAO|nr:Ig-like domain-containing protein [Leeuwenhoekiella marinoflava]RXG33163.1 endonuclease I [Leeuwenhoekiella marinoflava]SHE40796.1 Endonuclease I [Leeuwenhoekiella marinoflava DSM 3653]